MKLKSIINTIRTEEEKSSTKKNNIFAESNNKSPGKNYKSKIL